jgi:hypothetical protein
VNYYSNKNELIIFKKKLTTLFTIDSSSLHLIDNFFNFARSLSNSAHNSLFFFDNSTTFVAIASPPTVLAPKQKFLDYIK